VNFGMIFMKIIWVSFCLTKDELIFICEFWNDIYENNLGIVLRSQKVLGSMKKLKEEVK